MVPDKFNMVDMEGIDIIEAQGVEVPGLYQKLVESIAQCRFQVLYNWMFDGVIIPPTFVELEVNENDEVARFVASVIAGGFYFPTPRVPLSEYEDMASSIDTDDVIVIDLDSPGEEEW